jgi:hypothetical protein
MNVSPHLQSRKIRERGTSEQVASRRRYVPPKRRFTQNLHGATCQKTAFFVMFLEIFKYIAGTLLFLLLFLLLLLSLLGGAP